MRNNNKLDPHVTPGLRIEPGPGGWRRALSPLRQTYSPIITIMIRIIMMVIMIKTTMTIMMKIIIIIDKKIKTIKNIFETNNHNDLDTYTWFH